MYLTLACVDVMQLFLMLGIMFIGGPMLFVASLIPYRKATKALANSGISSPAALFGATMGLTMAWAGILALIVWIFANSLDRGGYAVVLCGVFGSVMLLWVLLTQLDQPKRKPEFPESARDVQPKRGPYQVWAQDLFVALLCYGAGLAILSGVIGPDTRHMDDFVRWAMYVLLAGTIGLLFAADFCRRQEWTQLPQMRAMIFVSVFTAFPLILPLAIMAWWRWRRTLSLQAKILHAAGDSRAEAAR